MLTFGTNENKKANTYGRDWIATAAAEYIMFKLVSGYLNGDADVLKMFDLYDFYFVPVVNPDGEFPHRSLPTIYGPHCSLMKPPANCIYSWNESVDHY